MIEFTEQQIKDILAKPTEAQIQLAVAEFARLHQLPMHHSPNEAKRSIVLGSKLKKMGLIPGFSDCFFFRCNKEYSGFFLELKVPPNKPTKTQLAFLELVKAEGYHGSIAYGIDDAIEQICWFYGLSVK